MAMDIESYRSYLRFVARGQLGGKLRRRVDSSDLVQETLLEAHRDLNKFRGKTPAELRAWLRQIMTHNITNTVRDHNAGLRDVKKECEVRASVETSSAWLENWVAGSPDGRSAASEERLLELCDAMEQLSEDELVLIRLKHWEGLTFEQIAKRLNRTQGSVTGKYYRALDALEFSLRRDEG